MLTNKYLKGAAAALCALALSSCASDYLDTPTHGSIPAENICATPESARMAMLGAQSGMAVPWGNQSMAPLQGFWQGETGYSYYMGELPGSDCYINAIYDQAPSWVLIYSMQENSLSAGDKVWNTTWWYYAYAMIAQVNEVLSVIDGADVGENNADKVALRDFTKAQAYALRAHCYWRLLQVYGPRWADSNNGEKRTVVLRTSPNDPQNKAVSTMNEVLDQCYSDLDNAIALFTSAGKSFRTLNYEINLNVAYGIYARVAALKNDWQTVRTMAHNARQGKRIATDEEAFGGYMSYNENEWMWAPSFASIDNFIYGNFCTFWCCNSYAALNARYTNVINRDLYKMIPAEDKRTNWWLTYEKMPALRPSMFYMNTAVNPATGAFKNARMISAARSWMDEHKPAGVTNNNAYETATTNDETTSIIRDGAQIKFWCNGLTGEDGLAQIPFMRATEMYLYEAEACAELGLTSEAQALLLEINQPRNASYTCSLTGQALIDEVRLYRRIELWGEGFCWFDLKRWGVNMTRTAWEAGNVNSGNIPAGLACDVDPSSNHGWRYGIPNTERTYNDFITEPIPGEVIVGE